MDILSRYSQKFCCFVLFRASDNRNPLLGQSSRSQFYSTRLDSLGSTEGDHWSTGLSFSSRRLSLRVTLVTVIGSYDQLALYNLGFLKIWWTNQVAIKIFCLFAIRWEIQQQLFWNMFLIQNQLICHKNLIAFNRHFRTRSNRMITKKMQRHTNIYLYKHVQTQTHHGNKKNHLFFLFQNESPKVGHLYRGYPWWQQHHHRKKTKTTTRTEC